MTKNPPQKGDNTNSTTGDGYKARDASILTREFKSAKASENRHCATPEIPDILNFPIDVVLPDVPSIRNNPTDVQASKALHTVPTDDWSILGAIAKKGCGINNTVDSGNHNFDLSNENCTESGSLNVSDSAVESFGDIKYGGKTDDYHHQTSIRYVCDAERTQRSISLDASNSKHDSLVPANPTDKFLAPDFEHVEVPPISNNPAVLPPRFGDGSFASNLVIAPNHAADVGNTFPNPALVTIPSVEPFLDYEFPCNDACNLSPTTPISKVAPLTMYSGRRSSSGRIKVPSKFCHICLRRKTRVDLLPCGNLIVDGSCTKVICAKCFEKFKWSWFEAVAEGSDWTCTHCREECPPRATCHIYNRTNGRRSKRLIQEKLKKGKDCEAAEKSGDDSE